VLSRFFLLDYPKSIEFVTMLSEKGSLQRVFEGVEGLTKDFLT
jgi:hypothetical protein